MRNPFPLRTALPLLLLLSTASLVHADDVKSLLAKRYATFNEAIKKNNFSALEKWLKAYCTSDFVYLSKDKQKYKLKDFINGMKQQTEAIKSVETSTVKMTSLKTEGAKTVASVTSDFKGKVSFQGQSLTLTDKSQTTDVWVKVGNDWKLKSMTQTKADTQMFQN